MTRYNIRKSIKFALTKDTEYGCFYNAYLEGAFNEVEAIQSGYSFDEFAISFSSYLQKNNFISVTFFANNKIIGTGQFWPRERILQIGDLTWFSNATSRQIFESCINFYDSIRKTIHIPSGKNYKILEFAHERDEKFFDRLAAASILERVGEIDGIYPDSKSIFYVSKEVSCPHH